MDLVFILLVMVVSSLACPCAERSINSLFTPYGYKFEGKNSSDNIYEWYKNTGAKCPEQGSWKITMSGRISVGAGSVRYQSENGYYWQSTMAVGGRFVYDGNFGYSGFQPSPKDHKWFGLSVPSLIG